MRPTVQNPVSRFIKEEEGARILALRARRVTIAEIARVTGRSETNISRYLVRHGVPRTRAPNRRSLNRRAMKITQLALQGLSEREVAEALKLTCGQVEGLSKRYELYTSQNLSAISDLSRETGFAGTSIFDMITRGEIEAGRWFRLRTFTPAQYEAALAWIRATYITAETARGWLTSTQAARELTMSLGNLISLIRHEDPRVAGIVRRRVIGMSGQVWRYDPATVLAAAGGLARRNLPMEYNRPLVLKTIDVAAIVHRTRSVVSSWATAGAPHLRDRTGGGRIWFHLPSLQAWLEAQPQPNTRRAAATLAKHLTVAEAVAS